MSLSDDLKRWVDRAVTGKLTGVNVPADPSANAELAGAANAAQGLDILKNLVKHKKEADDGGLDPTDSAMDDLKGRAQQVAVAVEKKITATLLAGNPAHGDGADQALDGGKDLDHAKAAIKELLAVKANLEAAGILASAAGPEHVRIDNRLRQLAVAAEKNITAGLLATNPAHGAGADQALDGGKDLSHAKAAIKELLEVKANLEAAGILAAAAGPEHVRIDNRLRQLAVAAEKAITVDLLDGAPDHDDGADQALAGGKTSDNAETAIQALLAVKANLEAAGIVNGDEHDRIDNRIAQLNVALIKNTKKEELESANTAADPNGIATVEDGRKQLKALDLAIQKAQRLPHQIVVAAAVTDNRDQFVIALNEKIEAERSAISRVASAFKTDPVEAQETATEAVDALHAANDVRDASLRREKDARLLGKPSDTVDQKAELRQNAWSAVRSDETVRDAIAQQKEAVVKAKEAVQKMKEAEKDAPVPETVEARQNIRATEYALFVEEHRFEAKQLAANIAVYEQRLKELTAAIRAQKLIVDDATKSGAEKAQAQKEIADLIGKAWQCADLLKKQKELGEKLLADAKKEDDDVLNEVPDDNDIYTAAHDADWTAAQTALQTEVGKVGTAVAAWETEYKRHNAKNPISAEHQAQEGWGVEECKVRAEFEMCVLLQYSPENIAKEPLFARYKAAMAMLYPEVEVIHDGADLEAKTEDIRRNITRFFEKDVSVRDPMVIGPIRHDDLRAFHAGNPSYRFKKDFTVDQQVAKIAEARNAGAVTVIAIQNSARPAQFYVAEAGQTSGFKTLPAYIENQVAQLNGLPAGDLGIAAIAKNIKDAMDSAAKDPRYFVDTESKVKDALADIDPKHAAQRTDLLDKADNLHNPTTPRVTSAGDASMLLDAEFSDIRRYFLCLTHQTNSDPAIKKSAQAVKKAYEDGEIKGDKADFTGNLPVDIVTMEKQNFKTNNTFKDNSSLVWTVKQPEDDKIELRCEDHELDLTVKPEKSDPTKSTIHWDSTKTGDAHDTAMLAGAALCAQTVSMNGCTSGDFDLGKTYDGQSWDSAFGGCKKRDLLEAKSVNAFLNSNVIVTFERHKKDKAPVWETYKSLVHGQTKDGVSTDAAAAGADAKYLDKLFDNPRNALFKQKLIHGMFEKTGTEYKGELYIWHEGKKYTEKELMHGVHTENGKPEHLGDTKVKEIIKAQAQKSTLDLLMDGRNINSSDAKKSSGATFTPHAPVGIVRRGL